MRTLQELCCTYISLLRSIYLIEQTAHWITKGSNFYSNHTMFERLYGSVAEDADLAAERLLGLFGEECLDIKHQAEVLSLSLKRFSSSNPIQACLDIENQFLSFSESFYEKIEKLGEMTLGLSDAITSISSHRETSIYLLQQANKQNGDNMKNAISKRINVLKQAQQITVEPEHLRKVLTSGLQAICLNNFSGVQCDPHVLVDMVNNRVIGNVKMNKVVSEEAQMKAETQFRSYTLLQLPTQLQDKFTVGLGFVLPPPAGGVPVASK